MAKLSIWLLLLLLHSVKEIYSENQKLEQYQLSTNCSTTVVELDKKIGSNTFVTKFRADGLEGENISYTLYGCNKTRPEFVIDNSTGIITTTKWKIMTNKTIFKLAVIAIKDVKPFIISRCPLEIYINDYFKIKKPELVIKNFPINLPVNSTIMKAPKKKNADEKIKYRLRGGKDRRYFKINKKSGRIFLQKIIDKPVGSKLKVQVEVKNMENPLKNKYFNLIIRFYAVGPVVSILKPLNKTIEIPENFNNFRATIVQLIGKSNINNKPNIRFELLRGLTESTNQNMTFRLEQLKGKTTIKLSNNLDYERIKKYKLKIRVLNDENETTEMTVNIFITDVNDNIPYFYQPVIKHITIPIDTIPGFLVTQVAATDNDGTRMHNQIKYKLNNYQDVFKIDETTGIIRTSVRFDSENIYNIEVNAFDNSPSFFHPDGAPNLEKLYLTICVGNFYNNNN